MIVINEFSEILNYIEDLKAIIFDLDDTLYSEKEYVKSGFKAVSKVFPEEFMDVENKLWNAFEKKLSAIDYVLINEGIFTNQLKEKCLAVYRHHFPNIHLYDTVEDILITLRKKGLKIGIITDGRPEGQRAKIKALNLEKYVDYIIVTDELGGIEYRKPNEISYNIMKNYFSLDYKDICYVGDNINKDFIAPQKLGMKSIWFRNPDGLYFQSS